MFGPVLSLDELRWLKDRLDRVPCLVGSFEACKRAELRLLPWPPSSGSALPARQSIPIVTAPGIEGAYLVSANQVVRVL